MSPSIAPNHPAGPERPHLTLRTSKGRTYTVPLGDGTVQPTAGGATYNETARAERTAITDFSGNELIRLDVPAFFDGWPKESIEKPLRNILELCRGQDGSAPTPFVARGPMPYSGLRYVMEFPEWLTDPLPIRRTSDGDLVRQALTLHFVQYVRPDAVRTRHVAGGAGGKPQTITITLTRPMSCMEIAGHYYDGDTGRGKEIAKLNGIRDPTKKLPVGTKVKLVIVTGISAPQGFGRG